jgi:hypothetical protein
MEEIKNSFITNVNILASISPTLENIGKNIVELKNISENNDTYNKIIILEDGILAIKIKFLWLDSVHTKNAKDLSFMTLNSDLKQEKYLNQIVSLNLRDF